jgi:hypothetical protein
MMLLVISPTASVNAPYAFSKYQKNSRMDLLTVVVAMARQQRPSGVWSSQKMKMKCNHKKRKLIPVFLLRMMLTMTHTVSAKTPLAKACMLLHALEKTQDTHDNTEVSSDKDSLGNMSIEGTNTKEQRGGASDEKGWD